MQISKENVKAKQGASYTVARFRENKKEKQKSQNMNKKHKGNTGKCWKQ